MSSEKLYADAIPLKSFSACEMIRNNPLIHHLQSAPMIIKTDLLRRLPIIYDDLDCFFFLLLYDWK